MAPRLRAWVKRRHQGQREKRERWQRAAVSFGLDGREWNEELIQQRYELTCEAPLVPEAMRERGSAATIVPGRP